MTEVERNTDIEDKPILDQADTSDLFELRDLLELKTSADVIAFCDKKPVKSLALLREHLLTALAFHESSETEPEVGFSRLYIDLLTRMILGDNKPFQRFDDAFKVSE